MLSASKKQLASYAYENMQRTGVAHLAHHDYPTLSGGEKQRVNLARVLTQVQQSSLPATIMLDEPTSSLDLAHQHHVLQLLKQLAQQGACIVVIIHDLNLAAQYADRIIMLSNGSVAADGSAKQVFTSNVIEEVYQYSATIMSHPRFGYPILI